MQQQTCRYFTDCDLSDSQWFINTYFDRVRHTEIEIETESTLTLVSMM